MNTHKQMIAFITMSIDSRGTKCIEWPFRRDRYGYGELVHKGIRKAHRVAYQFSHGDLTESMHVLHRCDNPCCINPSHLWLGTHADNMADMRSKERNERKKGISFFDNKGMRHGKAKLSDENIDAIRRLSVDGSMTQTSIASMFGVSRSTVFDIQRRRTWKHIL